MSMSVEEFYENALSLVADIKYGTFATCTRVMSDPMTSKVLADMRSEYGRDKRDAYLDLADDTIKKLMRINAMENQDGV
jgi:hypothetical protein